MLFRKYLKLLHQTRDTQLLISQKLSVILELEHVIFGDGKLLQLPEIKFVINLAPVSLIISFLLLLVQKLRQLILLLYVFVRVTDRCLS